VLISMFGIWALPEGGLFYGLLLFPFNGRLLQMVGKLAQEPDSKERAKGLFRWSILYLFGICLLLILSRQSAPALFDLQLREWLMTVSAGFPGIAP
jgi:protoheme IX farnesyltransferase